MNQSYQGKITTSIKYVVIAMSMTVAVSTSQADVSQKKIGDLEIYKAAEGGKVTIMMMLDTSGSMSEPYMRRGSACNLDNNNYEAMDGSEKYESTKAEADGTKLNFPMYGCWTGGSSTTTRKYFYRYLDFYSEQTTSTVYTGEVYILRSGKWRKLSNFTESSRIRNYDLAYDCGINGSENLSACTNQVSSINTSGMDYSREYIRASSDTNTSRVNVTQTITTQDDDGRTVEIRPGSVGNVTTKSIYNGGFVYNYYKDITTTERGNTPNYDRLTLLKKALFKVLDEGNFDATKISMGIGQYSSQTKADGSKLYDSDNPNLLADGVSGKILVPASLLTNEQISKIKKAVINLEGSNGTPTANAYAEVGAYMLGNNTSGTGSGFNYSISTSKSSARYSSPIASKSTASCDGRGIYFLTDGSPNSSTSPTSLMQYALDNTDFSGSSTMPNGSTNGHGMPQVGAFSKALRDGVVNKYGYPILTAVVGFGAEFKVDSSTVVELDKVAVDKNTGEPIKTTAANGTVTYTYEKNPDGTNKKAKYYDCNAITGRDAKNACNWGAKSHPDLGTTASPVGGFGEGGFYSAQSDTDVVDSIKQFVGDLNQTLPSTPSGTIVIPDDPYRADSQLAVAFYPTLQAEVGKSPAIWAGNLKKYSLKEGTLYGKSDSKLFTDIAGSLNPSTEDLWSAINVSGSNNEVTAGGFFSHLKTPNTALQNVRNLYVEDYTSTTDTKPILRKLGVNTTGQVTLDGNIISDNNNFLDTTTYNKERVQTLLQFLGFTLSDAQKATAIKDLVLTKPTSAVKILGATIHSTPSMVSYSATLDSNGKVTATRDDYVLFGSSDGALHLVGADDYAANNEGGREKFAFIPKAMLLNQAQALVNGQGSATGVPYFGVDAPWLVDAAYYYDYPNQKVTVEPCSKWSQSVIKPDGSSDDGESRDCRNTRVRAYGGLRMGGEGLYGLDLVDKNNPKALFKIDSSTGGFSRIGQIWAKPTKAKIATGIDSTTKKINAKDVLVFGGGYDMCYEYEDYQQGTVPAVISKEIADLEAKIKETDSDDKLSQNEKDTKKKLLSDKKIILENTCNAAYVPKGNTVYIIDAKTGDLIWSASGSATPTPSTSVSTMTNSIVGGITVLDRNNDGYMDQLYFADLGGQVFRADFTNAGATQYNIDGSIKMDEGDEVDKDKKPILTTSFANTRVVRLLQPAFSGADIKYNHRFYERPVVSFYRGDSTFNNSRLFAVVNVISGDRSSPLSKLRASDAYADRLYGIMDTDVTLADKILYADDFTTRTETGSTVKVQKINDLATSDLYAFDTTSTSALSLEDKKDMMYKAATSTMPATGVKTKKGWYYPLTRFDGFDRVKYTKGVGKSEVIDSFLYTTVYNPDMTYGATQACAAKVTGGSERQLYCLPFGVCVKEVGASDEYAASKNGTGGFVRAGQGIQELTLGPRSSTLSNQRLLIGTQTIRDRIYNRVNFGDDGGKLLAGDTGSNNIGLDRISQPLSGQNKTTGDGSAPENIYNDRYTLKPNTWFEVNK